MCVCVCVCNPGRHFLVPSIYPPAFYRRVALTFDISGCASLPWSTHGDGSHSQCFRAPGPSFKITNWRLIRPVLSAHVNNKVRINSICLPAVAVSNWPLYRLVDPREGFFFASCIPQHLSMTKSCRNRPASHVFGCADVAMYMQVAAPRSFPTIPTFRSCSTRTRAHTADQAALSTSSEL
jgi:hypothetical protein